MSKAYKPEGSPSVVTTIITTDSRALVAFCEKAFAAKDVQHVKSPDGKVVHGFMQIDGAPIYYSDAMGPNPATQSNTLVYVPDVDASFKAAIEAGATVVVPVADMFWGDRWCSVRDAWGNQWQIATHKEQVTPEEAAKRLKEHLANRSR